MMCLITTFITFDPNNILAPINEFMEKYYEEYQNEDWVCPWADFSD